MKTNAIFLTILPFREIHYFTCLIKYCYYNIMNLVCGQRQTFFRVFNFLCPGKMEFFSRIMPFSQDTMSYLIQNLCNAKIYLIITMENGVRDPNTRA